MPQRSPGHDEHRLSGDDRFWLGTWLVEPGCGQIRRDDTVVRVEPKAMDVLVYLASNAGRVISREELEQKVWRGALVGYDAVTHTVIKLRKALDDDPREPRYIATVPKRGYRLLPGVLRCPEAALPAPTPAITPVVALSPNQGPTGTETLNTHRWRRVAPIAILALVVLLAALFIVGRERIPVSEDGEGVPEPKTVAVLPFRNLSADSNEDYFAEGMSDDLITSLARFSDLQLVDRESTSFYRDTPLGAGEIADRLNARYLVRGSVQRTPRRVRISVRLIDAYSGETLWADSFDDDTTHLFEMQDRITHRIVVALTGRINVRDRQELSRPRTNNVAAYDAFLYGRQQFFLYGSAAQNRNARESFQRAIALDPDFALAYAMLAWTHAFDAMNGWSASRDTSLQRARDLASKALALDEAMPVAYFVRGLAYRELGDRARATVEAEKAIALDPNYAGAHVLLATLLYFDGRAQEGVKLMRRAIALNPNHPYNYSFHLGQALYILKRYDEAIAALNHVLESNPSAERAHLWLAAAYAQAGRSDDAHWELEQVRTADPAVSVERVRHIYPFTHPVDLEHFVEGLRKAGLSK
jgi:TolB-like protein/DNA-binding winged helix-turn-helix (wHTH) protein/tetratricopeptide (TPR) repeat protein